VKVSRHILTILKNLSTIFESLKKTKNGLLARTVFFKACFLVAADYLLVQVASITMTKRIKKKN